MRAVANGQPAIGAYTWHEHARCHLPFALDVLSVRDGRIEQITSFIFRAAQAPDGRGFDDYPDHAIAAARIADFERFGLPARLD